MKTRGRFSKVDADRMISAAKKARANAHAPYSHYLVGAAILTESGKVFAGCNVENASYGATICAERTALGSMIAAGETRPIACVVVTEGPKPGSPCGMCRQVLAEFAKDLPILLVAIRGQREVVRTTSLAKLLPDAFRGDALTKALQPREARVTKRRARPDGRARVHP